MSGLESFSVWDVDTRLWIGETGSVHGVRSLGRVKEERNNEKG